MSSSNPHSSPRPSIPRPQLEAKSSSNWGWTRLGSQKGKTKDASSQPAQKEGQSTEPGEGTTTPKEYDSTKARLGADDKDPTEFRTPTYSETCHNPSHKSVPGPAGYDEVCHHASHGSAPVPKSYDEACHDPSHGSAPEPGGYDEACHDPSHGSPEKASDSKKRQKSVPGSWSPPPEHSCPFHPDDGPRIKKTDEQGRRTSESCPFEREHEKTGTESGKETLNAKTAGDPAESQNHSTSMKSGTNTSKDNSSGTKPNRDASQNKKQDAGETPRNHSPYAMTEKYDQAEKAAKIFQKFEARPKSARKREDPPTTPHRKTAPQIRLTRATESREELVPAVPDAPDPGSNAGIDSSPDRVSDSTMKTAKNLPGATPLHGSEPVGNDRTGGFDTQEIEATNALPISKSKKNLKKEDKAKRVGFHTEEIEATDSLRGPKPKKDLRKKAKTKALSRPALKALLGKDLGNHTKDLMEATSGPDQAINGVATKRHNVLAQDCGPPKIGRRARAMTKPILCIWLGKDLGEHTKTLIDNAEERNKASKAAKKAQASALKNKKSKLSETAQAGSTPEAATAPAIETAAAEPLQAKNMENSATGAQDLPFRL